MNKATSAEMSDCKYLDETKCRPYCTILKKLYCATPDSGKCSFYKPLLLSLNGKGAKENA